MFFVVRSNDSFNFPLGRIKYIVTVRDCGWGVGWWGGEGGRGRIYQRLAVIFIFYFLYWHCVEVVVFEFLTLG